MTDHLRFDGRVAIVTGAGGNPGLGRSYAHLLASRGAKVLVNDLGVGPDGRGNGRGAADLVVTEIEAAGGEAVANADSVSRRDGASAIVAQAVDRWGRVDIVVNNAGIAPFAKFNEISDRDIERVVGVHLMGHIWMCRAAWPHMVEQGYGRIVNVSSAVAYLGVPNQSIYAAAKMGILGLSRALATEGLEMGIRSNVIMPAADTLAWQTMLGSDFSAAARAAGLLPEVVAPVAAYLAHESCTLSGKIVQTQAGSIHEVLVAVTPPTDPDAALSVEDVAQRISQGMDRSRATPAPDKPDIAIAAPRAPKPYGAEALID